MGVNDKPDKDGRACLTCGDVAGIPLDVESEHPEGVSATRRADGQKLFIDGTYLEVLKRRNRGRA